MKVKEVYKRKISQNEKVYIEMNKAITDFTMKIVVEGEGTIEMDRLRAAVGQAAAICPDSRVNIKNGYWVDTEKDPPVHEMYCDGYDGNDFSDGNMFKKLINPYKEPVTEVYVIRKKPCTLVFKIFHGVMDGRGALIWIENIFRALREEVLVEPNSIDTDLDFLRSNGYINEDIKLKCDCKLNIRSKEKISNNLYWKRISIQGMYIGSIYKIATVLNKYFENDNTRYVIPSNIRKYNSQIISTGNLTLPVYLEANKKYDWLNFYKNMLSNIEEKKDLNIRNADYGLLFKLPRCVLNTMMKMIIGFQNITKRYVNCGTITNLGKINLNRMSTNEFKANTVFVLPTHQPIVPLTIAITETKNRVEIIFSSHQNIISEEYANAILRDIRNFFNQENKQGG